MEMENARINKLRFWMWMGNKILRNIFLDIKTFSHTFIFFFCVLLLMLPLHRRYGRRRNERENEHKAQQVDENFSACMYIHSYAERMVRKARLSPPKRTHDFDDMYMA